MRHAKSSWAIPGQNDFDRALNERGKKDAPEMGKRIFKQGFNPQLIISSPAKRTLKTAKEVAKQLSYNEELIELENSIYNAHDDEIVSIIRDLDDAFNDVLVVGHNPAFTSIVGLLTTNLIENMPTAGVVLIYFDVQSWRQVSNHSGKLEWFDFPKSSD